MPKDHDSMPTVTPRLRFPEFREEKEWEANLAGDLFSNRVENGEDELPIYSVTIDDGMVKRSSLDRHVDDIADSEVNKKVHKGDIAYNMMRMWQGAFGVAVEDCMVSPAYVVLQPQGKVLSEFYASLLKLPQSLRLLTSYSHGLTKDRLRLYYKEFAQIPLPRPSLAEQQKIADCLTSLDEVVAAQGLKVEALRAHKRGLMQQLFPREGETRPRLRFPEFRDAPEWEGVELASICQIQRGKFTHRPRNDPRFFGGPYAFIQTGDVARANGGAVVASQSLNDLGLSVSKLLKPTIVLVTIAANIGDTAVLESEACFTDSVVGLIPKIDRVTPRFLESIVRLRKEYLNQVATTGAQKNINNEILSVLVVTIPSVNEQLQIEGCLSSLDAQIAAESEKLAALKTHKKGLMQQLFPAAEGD